MLIAYFCSEFALINDMPSYAGGLGILAGDYILEAADQNFPIVGIGLYYQKGQNSKNRDKATNPKQFGLKLLKKNWYKRLLIEIPIEDRTVLAQVWQWRKKKNSVYFLDTNLSENKPEDRLITEQLYAEDRDIRLKQELVLGLGGVRLIKELGLSPDLYHMNEGHSAFLCLQLIADKIKEGLNFKQAVEVTRKKLVFTNHTLVLEGQELFAFDALEKNTQKLCTEGNLNIKDIINLGRMQGTDTLLSMTTLALNMATLTNAVSKIHGEKARELWPNYPIIHITNGIYITRWDKNLGKDIVKTHQKNEEKLLKLIKKIRKQNWNEEALLIGWSRRFVPYKRPLAILEDVTKLKQLAEYFKGKIHIVYSAPLDPKDASKNEFLRRIYDLMNGELNGLITFIPNYRIEIAEILVAGCDIWLNTPMVGREACGTSGMKAALNGTLNISTNDGWINEVPLNDFGWIINDENVTANILKTLEEKVLPTYEYFMEDNRQSTWRKYMERSRKLILKNFSTQRMLAEYTDKLYKPVINKSSDTSKKLIAFDVDGTLSEPRGQIDEEMAGLLKKLLKTKKVAVISGGAFKHIKKQVLDKLRLDDTLSRNLILLPTNGSAFYSFDHGWKEIFSHKLSPDDKNKIVNAIKEVDQGDSELKNNVSYGKEIQDRESEITYSALGEDAPIKLKHSWDPDFKKRLRIQRELNRKLPGFEVRIGGTTSIDITPKGMDKAYGIQNLIDHLKLTKGEVLFFGDAIYPNGNDYPVLEMGVQTIRVFGPAETKKMILKILG